MSGTPTTVSDPSSPPRARWRPSLLTAMHLITPSSRCRCDASPAAQRNAVVSSGRGMADGSLRMQKEHVRQHAFVTKHRLLAARPEYDPGFGFW